MSNNVFWAVLAVAVIGFVGFMSLGSNDETNVSNNGSEQTATSQALYLSKASDEQLVVVEYSDFECPACRAVSPLIELARVEFVDQVSFEFRHFPLIAIHPNAMVAHRIAQAADNQGQFVAVHDLLYRDRDIWVNAGNNASQEIYNIIQASSLDIDSEQLKTDMAKSETLDAINADIAQGEADGVDSTPTVLIDDQEVTIRDYDQFKQVLQSALDAKLSGNN